MAGSQRRGRSHSRDTRDGPAFIDDLLAMAGSLASSRKDYASAQLESLADSLRQFGHALPALPTMRGYAEGAAASLEDLADYVLDSDLPEIVADARDVARRHPLATFGGSVLAGVVLTQLLHARAGAMRSPAQGRSSSRRRPRATTQEDSDGAA